MLVETINLVFEGVLTEKYADEIGISFPEYYDVMKSLLHK